jgi:hypothetical protein
MRIILAIIVPALFVFGVAWQPPEDKSRYLVQPPMDFSGSEALFRPDQMVWVKPLIRTLGCVFAQNAVRHHLRPAAVGFAPCNLSGEIQIELDRNLIDMTVSGIATVDGANRPFTVTLQHNPPTLNEGGFIATSIDVR